MSSLADLFSDIKASIRSRNLCESHYKLQGFHTFTSSSPTASGHRPTESSSGSFHSSREPLGVHTSWTDKPMGQSVNPHHNLPSNSDLYRENIPAADFQLPHSRELNPPAVKPGVEKEKKMLRDIPPLCASRLKPIRQKTKNAVVRCCLYFLILPLCNSSWLI